MATAMTIALVLSIAFAEVRSYTTTKRFTDHANQAIDLTGGQR